MQDCRMKAFVKVMVIVMVFTFFSVGSALKCYRCEDDTGSCSSTETCSGQSDACLRLSEKNGRIYRQCVRSSDCHSTRLSVMFPSVAKFSYSCCSSDLCNGASASVGRISVMALLLSLVLSWCFF